MLSIQQDVAATQTRCVAGQPDRFDYLELAEWQEFVELHPDSTVFHHRNWIELIKNHYGLTSYFPCLRRGEEIAAAVPFLSCRSLFGARKLVCLPYSDYLRVLGRRPHAAESLINALRRNHPPCDCMGLRTDTALADVPSTSHSVRHEVRLASSAAALWKMFRPSIHRNIKKAQRAGLQFVKRTDRDAMEAFYQLHVLTRRKLGVPVQPKRFFERLQQQIVEAGLGYVGLVLNAERPVAGGVLLTFNRTVTYKYAASHPAALADRPNDLLVYSSLRLAAEDGFQVFDFGISNRKHEGLRRFKQNWGADEIDVHSVQIVGRERMPTDESKLLKLTKVMIRNSPAIVCRSLGEVFYRFAN
jgi:CelD/BcsL family acetyltransferase involved in cellulose biosynthesis